MDDLRDQGKVYKLGHRAGSPLCSMSLVPGDDVWWRKYSSDISKGRDYGSFQGGYHVPLRHTTARKPLQSVDHRHWPTGGPSIRGRAAP